jgi:hypothetical protein
MTTTDVQTANLLRRERVLAIYVPVSVPVSAGNYRELTVRTTAFIHYIG